MDEIIEEAVEEAAVEEAPAVTITCGIPDRGASATRAERLTLRAALAPEDVELALTYVAADLSGLELGEQLFSHEVPAERPDAVWLKLTGETPETSTDCRCFTAQLSGREVARGAVSPGIFSALGKLPVRWLTAAGGELSAPVTVAELKLVRPAQFGCAFVGGRRAATFDAELSVRIRTSPLR